MLSHKFCNSLKIIFLTIVSLLMSGCNKLIVLHSKGPVGQEETLLIYKSIGAMLIVIVPVFVMAYWFVKRYRHTNKNSLYQPNWVHSTKIELVIWLVPLLIVGFLSSLVWIKTYELDPYKPLASANEPLNIQVISLDWNWLFIYPDYDVALVNELVIPEKVPLSFRLTSATVMTSFFIPQLGSQMYAMAGMQTRLHLLANETGTYEGHNIEYSGKGYDTMHFKVIAMTQQDFAQWIATAKNSQNQLDLAVYATLSQPSMDYPVTIFSPVEPGLFEHVMHSFMGWMGEHQNMHHGPSHEMDSMKKGN